MTQHDEVTAHGAGLLAIATASIGESDSSEFARDQPSAPGSTAKFGSKVPPLDKPRPLRIGDKVRSFVDDVCVSVGLTGIVVNVAPPHHEAPGRARILWDNETESMADFTTFKVVPKNVKQELDMNPKAS